MDKTLPFPIGRPEGYMALDREPAFNPARHLDLQAPAETKSLSDLGYSDDECGECPSGFGVSSAFRILSDEGVEVLRDICRRMQSNLNKNTGTGENRLGSYIRGAGYRSQFVKDFCEDPDLASHLSSIAETSLARHSVPAVACGVNYAPDDITKAVDNWHVDSVSFDVVLMISDPAQIEGGEFQYFHGTKHEGRDLLGISGEEGKDAELPADKIRTVEFPAAGYGFLQQGNMIFHRACRLKKKTERITMIPSFVSAPVMVDETNSVNMSAWSDPGIRPELARHEVWRAAARLDALIDKISLQENDAALDQMIADALTPLEAFRRELREQKND